MNSRNTRRRVTSVPAELPQTYHETADRHHQVGGDMSTIYPLPPRAGSSDDEFSSKGPKIEVSLGKADASITDRVDKGIVPSPPLKAAALRPPNKVGTASRMIAAKARETQYLELSHESGRFFGSSSLGGSQRASAPIQIDEKRLSARDKEDDARDEIKCRYTAAEAAMFWRLSDAGMAVKSPDEEERDTLQELPERHPLRHTGVLNTHGPMGSRKRSSGEMLFAMDGLEL